MRHLIDSTDLSRSEIDSLITLAQDIIAAPEMYSDSCHGRKLATIFYEPSTRTRLSFTSAMMELGGNVLGFSDAASSSASKGEGIADTIRVIDKFADIVAMRHFKEGAALVAAQHSAVPIINAGDGSHNHPTQTLTDLLTIVQEMGHVDGLTIGFCGDLKFGRTVHSLIKALKMYHDIKIVLISPSELQLPSYVKDEIAGCDMEITHTESLEEALPQLDVLYMTRVQQERFATLEEYERLKDCYILDEAKMTLAKEEMVVLHPLPRVNEITRGVDADPRAAYFRQVEYGKYIRMALIFTLLKWKKKGELHSYKHYVAGDDEPSCVNAKCITATEDVDKLLTLDAAKRCAYCDKTTK
ncbi:MAG: aspartate carbamoyltransferase [Rikenellaceae bacterium]